MFSPCILLVDNDVKLLVKLEPAFKRAGYRVLTANNSIQAIYLAQAALPEVIVCYRPAELEVRRTLAQDSQTASIPFIPLTKPLDQHELVARVNAIIRSYAMR
jgi:DNA-binding response OmpR family regulator